MTQDAESTPNTSESQKPWLEDVYGPSIDTFLWMLGQRSQVASLTAFRFWEADFELVGPWNVFDFPPEASVEELESAVESAKDAHHQGLIRRFGVRLSPRNDPALAKRIESLFDWSKTPIRPLRSEVVVCQDNDTGHIRPAGSVDVQALDPTTADFELFAATQLIGYGFALPTPRDCLALADMYRAAANNRDGKAAKVERRLEKKYGRPIKVLPGLPHLLQARIDDLVVGTIAAIPHPPERAIGLYGLAVLPQARNRGVGRTLVREAIEYVRGHYPGLGNSPRPPTIVALCDGGRHNERLLMSLGFRRAEVRPIYAGIPDLEATTRKRLRELRWRIS